MCLYFHFLFFLGTDLNTVNCELEIGGKQMLYILTVNHLVIRGMAGKFVDTISIFNRKRNSVKMNISGFAKIFHEQTDEIL